MIRRAKIKAKPIIRKSKTAAAKSEAQRPPKAVPPASNHSTLENDKHTPSATTAKGQTSCNSISPEKIHVDSIRTPLNDKNESVSHGVDERLPCDGTVEVESEATKQKCNPSRLVQDPLCEKSPGKPDRDPSSVTELNTEAEFIPVAPTVTQTSLTASMLAEKDKFETSNDKKNMGNNKSTIPGGRRRKLLACPTTGKRRRKTDVPGEFHKESTKITDLNLIVSETDVPIVNITSPSLSITEQTTVKISDLETISSKEVETSEELLTNVAALTTITQSSSEPAIDDLPIFGISPSKEVNSIAVAVPVPCVNKYSVCDSGDTALFELAQEQAHTDQLTALENTQSRHVIQRPKKCIIKVKSKTLSSKYRSKAMEKLNHLKQTQSDQSEWPELDQNYVSMSDLIFLNPPPKVGHKLGMNVGQEEEIAESTVTPVVTNEEQAKPTEDINDTPMPVPQLRIAEDGSIVVDEESLVLDTQKPPDPTVAAVYESGRDSSVNQRSFMRRGCVRGVRWSVEETNKFYQCLRVVGAEFSLMSAMFRGRTPDDLRRKFRREHKNNPTRVDEAVLQQHLNKWTDDMFESAESTSAILQPPQQTAMQS